MASKTNFSTCEARNIQGLGLHLCDKYWISFEQKEEPAQLRIQRVSRMGLTLTDSHYNHRSVSHVGGFNEGEVSRWSSDNSESDYEESSSDIEFEAEHIDEGMEQRLERHRRFFRGQPLMRCLEEEEFRYQEWMDALFYSNLCHEVQQKVKETRRQDVVKEFWRNIRMKLIIDDLEIYDPSDLMTESEYERRDTVSFPEMISVPRGISGWKRPSNMCSSSGKDLDLQNIRDFWTEKKRNNVGKAKTF